MNYLIYGPEPFERDRKKCSLTCDMDNIIHVTAFSPREAEELLFPGLYSSQVVLTLDSDKGISYELLSYLKNPNPNSNLIIIMNTYNARSRNWKALLSIDGIDKYYCSVYDRSTLSRMVISVLKKNGKQIREETLNLLLERTGYGVYPGVTAYTIYNYLSNLIFACKGEEIDEGVVKDVVPETEASDRFSLARLIDNGDGLSALRQCGTLCTEAGGINILSILMKEFRIAYKRELGFSQEQIGGYARNFRSWRMDDLVSAMEQISDAIEAIKKGTLPEASAVAYTVAALSRKGVAYAKN